jgi:hypothetical protein
MSRNGGLTWDSAALRNPYGGRQISVLPLGRFRGKRVGPLPRMRWKGPRRISPFPRTPINQAECSADGRTERRLLGTRGSGETLPPQSGNPCEHLCTSDRVAPGGATRNRVSTSW